jgi:U-box domain
MISTPIKYENDNIPNEYICPLTLEIMVDPLMDRFGRSYERSAILEWIATRSVQNNDSDNTSPTCPITRRPLYAKDLISNNKLRKEILEWRYAHGDDVTTDDIMMDQTTQLEEEVNRALKVWGNVHAHHLVMKEQQRTQSRRNNNHYRWIRLFSNK